MKDGWKKNTVKLAAGALAFGLGAAAPVTALAGTGAAEPSQTAVSTVPAACGWQKIADSWYCLGPDGMPCTGEQTLGDSICRFSEDGVFEEARWIPGTGGGPYTVGCFEAEEQALFDRLSEEKAEEYFDLHPDREEDYAGDMRTSYDRYAGFFVEDDLNRAAAARLSGAMENGYADGKVYGQGELSDYLASISYRSRASCLELYLRSCQDGEEAYEKAAEWLDRKREKKDDRKYMLEYYRYLGMASAEKEGKRSFLVILLR